MAPGRNDPCPCGSGKKYKHCCARHDATASPLLRVAGKGTRTHMESIAATAIRAPVAWEADVTPVPMSADADPSSRPAAVILAANDVILHMELEPHPPSDPAGMAKLLASAIKTVLARGGAPATELRVRHAAVATELRQLVGAETKVVEELRLATIRDFATTFRQQISGLPLPGISQPQTWSAWDLPAETLNRLFSAAAAYHTAAPWLLYGDDAPLELEMPNGSVWNAVVLGYEGEEHGLVLYESFDDYLGLMEAPDADVGFGEAEKVVLCLSFDARADLPKAMRREFSDANWTVAGPAAYPSLWALNTIGGGLSMDQANDLAMALEVTGRLGALSEEDDTLLAGHAPQWTDDTSGTIVRWALEDDEPLFWEIPERLTSSLAHGARADATLRSGTDEDGERDAAIVDRFVATMRASGADADRITRDEREVDLFVQVVHGVQGIQLPALTELDLRTFLYDQLPRKAMVTKEHGNAIRESLQRFFEYLAANEELEYPWAAAILGDTDSFEERLDTCPLGGQETDALAAWMGDFFMDLDARVMLPANQLAVLGEWREVMGVEEARLYGVLQREWLIWRDAEIALGVETHEALWEQLTARQAAWEQAPQPQLGGRSPVDVITTERSARRAKPRGRRR